MAFEKEKKNSKSQTSGARTFLIAIKFAKKLGNWSFFWKANYQKIFGSLSAALASLVTPVTSLAPTFRNIDVDGAWLWDWSLGSSDCSLHWLNISILFRGEWTESSLDQPTPSDWTLGKELGNASNFHFHLIYFLEKLQVKSNYIPNHLKRHCFGIWI